MKQKILSVATQLFAQNGFNGTSLQAIADAVGLRKPSLLHHFPSKEAIREAVLDDLLDRWQSRLPQVLTAASGGTRRFDAVFAEVGGFFRKDPNRARLILREVVDRPQQARERLGATIAPWGALLTDSIRSGQEDGRIQREVDAQAWLVNVVILLIGTIATTELVSVAFHREEASAEERTDRQLKELARMARTSLYVKSVLQETVDEEKMNEEIKVEAS